MKINLCDLDRQVDARDAKKTRKNTTAGWRASSKLKKGQEADEDATSLLSLSLSLSLSPSSTSVMIGRQEKAEGKLKAMIRP